MDDNRKKIPITTLVERDLWLKAKYKGIQWVKAVDVGLKLLLGMDNREEEIKDQISQKTNEIELLRQKLTEIKIKKEEEEAKERSRVILSDED